MKITREEKVKLDEILFDWYEIFGDKSKKGNYKNKAYEDLLIFVNEFISKGE